VLHAPARRGGIWRASQKKINNLETNEFVSNPPFLKKNWREYYRSLVSAGTMDYKKIENLEFLKKKINSGTLARKLFQ
jgi:hypothetical protein